MKMPPCPSLFCSLPVDGPKSRRIVRAGFFRRKGRMRKTQRYRCKDCGRFFSEPTNRPTYYQKRPDLNPKIRDLLCSQVSQRRCAKLLGISRTTVVRKFRFMARQAALESETRLEKSSRSRLEQIQVDDLLTSIHSKCKPVSVSLAVDAKTREIIGLQVSDIPARPPLVEISLRKYGPRKDERRQGLRRLFQGLKNVAGSTTVFRSDCDPEYPKHVRSAFPHASHEQVRSRRARTAGFGELKRIGFDPIFSLNHTCAMLRANLNRLARRTWCTSKTKIGLLLHLELYRHYHNTELCRRSAI